jgi:glutamate-1-semialdehyde 2,1-aminomutase
VAGRAEIMKTFDYTGDAHHDRHGRVTHLGTFNASPLSAAAGMVVLNQVATGEPIGRANAAGEKLRKAWEGVLEKNRIAGYVYGNASIFHVYFETDLERIHAASDRRDLYTRDARRLKGMPAKLITEYQRNLRYQGVDIMSSTGGLLSSAHTDRDIDDATTAFEHTIRALHDQGLIHSF